MTEGPPLIPVERVPRLNIAPVIDSPFRGFEERAFQILERLRLHPHVEQYRTERDGISRFLTNPFKDYRDALVMGAVLPNHLDLETERNVFSRLLKNDFGRGGCHHHYWMSFYRRGLTRLRDLQLIHSIHPDAFYVGVSASRISREALNRLRHVLDSSSRRFVELVSSIADGPQWSTVVRLKGGVSCAEVPSTAQEWSDLAPSVEAVRLMRRFGRDEVLGSGPALVDDALIAVKRLWPLYLLLLPDPARP